MGGISFTASDFDLRFDGNVGVMVRGEYSIQTRPGSEPETIEVPEFQPELTKLLEQTVENETMTKDGALAIQFSSGAVLTCYHRIPGDDSYGIYIAHSFGIV